jgi:hypothetical protein
LFQPSRVFRRWSAVVIEAAHREIEHLQGGPLAEDLAAVAGGFAQPGLP